MKSRQKVFLECISRELQVIFWGICDFLEFFRRVFLMWKSWMQKVNSMQTFSIEIVRNFHQKVFHDSKLSPYLAISNLMKKFLIHRRHFATFPTPNPSIFNLFLIAGEFNYDYNVVSVITLEANETLWTREGSTKKRFFPFSPLLTPLQLRKAPLSQHLFNVSLHKYPRKRNQNKYLNAVEMFL